MNIKDVANNPDFSQLFEYEVRIKRYYHELLELERTGQLTKSKLSKIKQKILLTKESNDVRYQKIRNEDELWKNISLLIGAINPITSDYTLDNIVSREAFDYFVRINRFIGPYFIVQDNLQAKLFYTPSEIQEKQNTAKEEAIERAEIKNAIELEFLFGTWAQLNSNIKVKNNRALKSSKYQTQKSALLKCRELMLSFKYQILYYNQPLEHIFLQPNDFYLDEEFNFVDDLLETKQISIAGESFIPNKYNELAKELYVQITKNALELFSSTHQDERYKEIIEMYLRTIYNYIPELANAGFAQITKEAVGNDAYQEVTKLNRNLTLSK